MAWYPARGGGIPASVKTDMNAVLNKKFGTSGQTYPPKEWADDVNLMGVLPTRTATGAIANFSDGADDVPIVEGLFEINPYQEGSGDPSPSNKRAIHGFTGLNAKRTGKNLFDEANATLSNLSLSNHVFTNTNTDTRANLQFQAVLLDDNLQTIQSLFSQNVTETGAFSRTVTITNSGYSKLMIKHNGSTRDLRIIVPFTYPKETVTISANFLGVDVQTVGGLSFENLQIEVGSTATTYEPYTATVYPVSWQTEAGTVYGGFLNITTGVLTIEWDIVDMGDLSYTYDATYTRMYANISDMLRNNTPRTETVYCDIYKCIDDGRGIAQVPDLSIYTGGVSVYIKEPNYTDPTTFKTAVTGHKIVYPLAEPTEVQLTPQEVRTLLGSNNIYHDCNGDSTIEYRADIDLLISELGG